MFKKEYQKPEVEVISLVMKEEITNGDDDLFDGEMGDASSIW